MNRARILECAKKNGKSTFAAEIALASDLKQRRDDMRMLLGDGYASEVATYRLVLRGKTTESGAPIADVALGLARELDAAGHDPSMVFAALVDECESRPLKPEVCPINDATQT